MEELVTNTDSPKHPKQNLKLQISQIIKITAPPLLFLIVAIILWTQTLKPLAVNFIVQQIPKLNSTQDLIYLEIKKIDLSLLKLQLTIDDLKIFFKKEVATKNSDQYISPLVINTARVQLDIFDLIIGQINISKVIIDTIHWDYNVRLDNTKKSVLPAETIFNFLQMIPIDRLIVYNSNMQLTATQSPDLKGMVAKIHIPHFTIINDGNELSLSYSRLNADIAVNKKSTLTLESTLNLSLKKNELSVNEFKLQVLDSQLALSAKLQNVENLIALPKGQINFISKINLQDLRTSLLMFLPQKNRLPAITGFLNSSGLLNLNSTDSLTGSIDIGTTQVIVDQFKLGQAQISASIQNNTVELNEIKLEHPAGSVHIKNVKIEKNPPYKFSTSLVVNNFDLQRLFLTLGLNDVPAGFLATGTAVCNGELKSTLSTLKTTGPPYSALLSPIATCNTQANMTSIWVKTSLTSDFYILKLKQAELIGETEFNKDGLTYDAHITVGNSRGTSSGQVSFDDGFNIKFATDHLNFADVESFADLDIKGLLKINGTARGNASMGIAHAHISMINAEIDDFNIGDFNADVEYRNTLLKFSRLIGWIGKPQIKLQQKSQLSGFLNFNFTDSTLEGNLHSSRLNGADILPIINKKFNIPFEFSGLGEAEVDFNGPFNFWKLAYNLKSEFHSGILAGESFTRLDLNLTANGTDISFNKVILEKLKSKIILIGNINTRSHEPKFNLQIKANPFLLEEIDHLTSYAPVIAGIGYAEGQISGTPEFPEVIANFTLKQVSYDKTDYPNSQGKLILDKNYLKFNGEFFGRQVQSDLIWPWNKNNNFSAKILINDLNPLFLLPLISIPQPSSDFNSKLSAEVDLTSKSRNISSANGYIKITDFFLTRGAQFLKLENPSRLTFNSGFSHMDNFVLKGDDSLLSVKLDQKSADQVKLNVMADLQLKILHFLVPFTQSLSGNLVIDSQILLKNNSFELFGSGELTNGNITIKDFPQAIENINTPIEFSKSKIFLSDITGQFGPSDVTGIGRIDILGPKNISVNLYAIADNVELNFPDKISTAGKAHIFFTGNWLPYNLKIDYKVSHGLVEKDFTGGSNQSTTLKPSSFLPPKQIGQLSPSLSLEINVDITKNGVIIKNKLLEGEATGLLKISGSPKSPIIQGKVDLKPNSKLIFKDTPFNIQTASINFQQTKQIDPDIYISANARVSDYDINLLVQGSARNLTIKPTSQPPLSESDIFSLLALGVTSQTDQNLSSDTQQKQTGLEVLAAISNQSQLNRKIQDKLGLTVQLAPSIDSTKNIAVPKVVVSKKLSKKLNASYSKPFTGNDQNQEIKLQYLYNNSLSLLLNYQNKDTTQQDQISNNTDSKGIWGLDIEYRDDFK